MLNPTLISSSETNPDAAKRADWYLSEIVSAGSYSHSLGIPIVRKTVANFLHERDGVPTPEIDDIYMTEGASQGVHLIINSIITNPNDGIMIPIPQYPLYSAAISLYGGSPVPYYLNEEEGWQLDEAELEQALAKGKEEGKNAKCLVVINPGNPTGAIFSEDTIGKILRFATKNKLVVIADEVSLCAYRYIDRTYTRRMLCSCRFGM